MSKDFLPLHFAVDHVLSISRYDLENGRMPCKQKYCINNMAVKIPILILLCFSLLCWLKNHLFCILPLLYLQVVLIIQALVDGFSPFQRVLPHLRWFQVVLGRSSDGFSLFQVVLIRFRWFQVDLDRFRSFQLVPQFSKYRKRLLLQLLGMKIVNFLHFSFVSKFSCREICK